MDIGDVGPSVEVEGGERIEGGERKQAKGASRARDG